MNKIILKMILFSILLCLFQVTCKKNEKSKAFNTSIETANGKSNEIEITNSKTNEKEINEYPISNVMQFLSMGFNAKDEVINAQDNRSVSRTKYYFYGYKDYSEAFIDKYLFSLSTGEPGAFYPNSLIEYKLEPLVYEQLNAYEYRHYAYATGFVDEVHNETGGKLLYWALRDTFETIIRSDMIEQKENEIIIHANKEEFSYQFRYYNISQKELLDIFLSRYVDLICHVNKLIIKGKIDTDELDDVLIPLLQGRTTRELEIFKNCLFAAKGLKFQTQEWTDFFNMYLVGYDGKFTNNEVMAMFMENEKMLLDLIEKYENKE